MDCGRGRRLGFRWHPPACPGLQGRPDRDDHARSRALDRFFLGGVADELIRQAAVPVLLVRPRDSASGTTPEPLLEHVLVPLDGSPLAERVLEPALEFVRLWKGRCTLLRVIEATPATTAAWPNRPCPPEQQQTVAAEAYLEKIAGRLRAEGTAVQTRLSSPRTPHPPFLSKRKRALRFHRPGDARMGRPAADALGQRHRQGDPRIFSPRTRVPADWLRRRRVPTVGAGFGIRVAQMGVELALPDTHRAIGGSHRPLCAAGCKSTSRIVSALSISLTALRRVPWWIDLIIDSCIGRVRGAA